MPSRSLSALLITNRVVSTFNTKIALHGLEDYLFLFSQTPPEADARAAAHNDKLGQGPISVFLPVAGWLVKLSLGTIVAPCRRLFAEKVIGLLEQPTVPAHVKVAWNEKHASLLR